MCGRNLIVLKRNASGIRGLVVKADRDHPQKRRCYQGSARTLTARATKQVAYTPALGARWLSRIKRLVEIASDMAAPRRKYCEREGAVEGLTRASSAAERIQEIAQRTPKKW